MSAEVAHERVRDRPRVASLRPKLVLGVGWTAVVAGVLWAVVQPWRLTILHPFHQGFWWLVSEPPLYVVVAGLVFRFVVAPPLLRDLRSSDRELGR
jgi:hypothetical protein